MTVSVYAFAAMMLLVGLSVLVWLWRGDRPTAGFGNRQLFMTRGSSIKPTDAAKQHAKPQTALAVVGALTLLACWATYRRGRGGR